MSYYQSNAVYKALDQATQHPFTWVSGNAWMLVYGDSGANPRVLVLAHGTTWVEQALVIATLDKLAAVSGLPVVRVKFDDTTQQIGNVEYSAGLTSGIENITLTALKNRLQAFGLPVKTGVCGKSINDTESSAYHKWQRNNLGAITVSDVDLVRLDGTGTPLEIVELKRSYYTLNNWKPFTNDFPNFNLILSVATKAKLRFTIAYNHRQNEPFKDDASILSIFNYGKPNNPVHLGQFSFPDFVEGKY